LLIPAVLGLRVARGVMVGKAIEWPLANLRNVHIDENVSLGKRGWFHIPLDNRTARICIGAGSAIGDDFVITSNASITVGRDCLLSYRVTLMDHAHVTGDGVAPVNSGLTSGRPIAIGDRCFIGCNVVVMPGVTLGANCVVGANSVVTHSFDDDAVLAGSPARLLRSLRPAAGR